MKTILILLLSLHLSISFGQKIYFDIQFEPIEIEGLGGLQSYAYGQLGEEWIIIGGRLDGLHQRQPFASFNSEGNNNLIVIVNPIEEKVWNLSLEGLPVNLADQLHSTNMQFYQTGQFLILTGGYGYSAELGDHTTYPNITIVNLESLVNAIKTESSIEGSFVQIEDENFAVAGGRIKSINDTYYLVGGHRFEGRYNPHGPTHGPGFIQEYTYEIRPFILDIDWPQVEVQNLAPTHDEMHLRRRDYNLSPYIYNGQEAMMLFSGVFNPTVDLPWLYPVLIQEDTHQAFENFSQYYNHYHCPTIPMYSETTKEMHTLFFGGIAQFYNENGLKVQDNDVPFVKTIAVVSSDEDMNLEERVLIDQMPDYIGAGAEFILNPSIAQFDNGVVKLDDLNEEPTFIGTIFGGIKSSEKNIFWINTGAESIASPVLYKVYITPKSINATSSLTQDKYKLLIYPNPTDRLLRIAIELDKTESIKCTILDQSGQAVKVTNYGENKTKPGLNIFEIDLGKKIDSSFYIIKMEMDDVTLTRKIIISE